jgi:deoxyribose-phosphate aldolase
LSSVPVSNYADLAGLIDYALTRSELSEADVARGCELAKQQGVASVMVRPSDIDLAARWMAGSAVRLGTLVDSPHGYSTTAAKTYAARDLLRRGVQEIDTVMNTGKLKSRQFQYLETELLQMADACHQSGALLKVNLESEFLTEELNIIACRIARRAGADYIGTNKLEDIALLLSHSRDRLKIKCHAQIADLGAALTFRESGCARIEIPEPAPVLEAWRARCEDGAGGSGLGTHERSGVPNP